MISDEMRQANKEWLNAGDSLADVQRKLKEKFDLVMTYMDVRLLVIEIGAEVQDKPEPAPAKKPLPPKSAPHANAEGMDEVADASDTLGVHDDPDAAADDALNGTVSVAVDRVVLPGAMVSGSVVFSDGVKARWMIDRMGRFGLEPDVEGYQPSEMDLQEFQMELRSELARMGYA
jgi:hypothetical protein